MKPSTSFPILLLATLAAGCLSGCGGGDSDSAKLREVMTNANQLFHMQDQIQQGDTSAARPRSFSRKRTNSRPSSTPSSREIKEPWKMR